jgi:hypothetical protein
MATINANAVAGSSLATHPCQFDHLFGFWFTRPIVPPFPASWLVN